MWATGKRQGLGQLRARPVAEHQVGVGAQDPVRRAGGRSAPLIRAPAAAAAADQPGTPGFEGGIGAHGDQDRTGEAGVTAGAPVTLP
ncbi:hypothetical protein ADT26_17675 [Xanthomonas oryzae]|nr:hypothetical protein AXO1947_07155 [Xanthomonas oryzae pv. oryzae]KOR40539.1 hypothetical protein ADT26_17675 [Xanthomonas oryzae]AUJ13177.1 hypothetical protein BVV20_14850 [Xanthomonas oryzae pv. oryzae]AVT99712.1 hypothetical protein C0L89_14370 [Xanthomonas oryzae pv. oryzae]AVU03391.1 hypothetical protein C0L90_14575 [Xanthomonas oryzae pv. oryzae]